MAGQNREEILEVVLRNTWGLDGWMVRV